VDRRDRAQEAVVLGVDDYGDAVAMLTVWGLRGVSVQ
jgi:hypothetical protein